MFGIDAEMDETFVDYFNAIDRKKVCPQTYVESEIIASIDLGPLQTRRESESEKDQRTSGKYQKKSRQSSKKIFAFAYCKLTLKLAGANLTLHRAQGHMNLFTLQERL